LPAYPLKTLPAGDSRRPSRGTGHGGTGGAAHAAAHHAPGALQPAWLRAGCARRRVRA